jgi:hypothetical protein
MNCKVLKKGENLGCLVGKYSTLEFELFVGITQ